MLLLLSVAEAAGGPRRRSHPAKVIHLAPRLRLLLLLLLELSRDATRRLRAFPRRRAQPFPPAHPRGHRPSPVPRAYRSKVGNLSGPVLVEHDKVVILPSVRPKVVVLRQERDELRGRPVVRQPCGVPTFTLQKCVEQKRAPSAALRGFVHVKVQHAARFHLLDASAGGFGDEEPLGTNLEDAE